MSWPPAPLALKAIASSTEFQQTTKLTGSL
jgi:hypothetical protein